MNNMQIIQQQATSVFSVKNFGATGNGTTDDTTAILAAMAACVTAGGGIVLFPEGTYVTSASLVINIDGMGLMGVGFDSIIKPAASSTFDVISTPIPGTVGASGYVRNYVNIAHLMIDCSNMTGTVAGQGNGIHFYGTRYSTVEDVFINHSPNWAILLDGDNTGPGNNFGYDNKVVRCIFDLCNAGCYQTSCEANDFLENRFKWAGAATAAAQPVFGTTSMYANHLQLGSGYAFVAGNVFGKGGAYTTPSIICSNNGPCRIIGNRFDQVRAQAATLNAGNHEFIGNALGSPCSAALGNPAIQLGNSNNRVIGNSFDNTAGSTHHTYCVQESGGPFSNNIIADNMFIPGTSGTITLNATSTDKVHHNAGYNPVGPITPPAVPATTVAYTNNYGVDMTVFVNGGTVTVVAIGGTTTGQVAGLFRVPAGQTITLTYSVAPTWTWFGD